jgi:hypothetical protein
MNQVIQNITNALSEYQKFVGNKWHVSLNQNFDGPGYTLGMYYKLDYFTFKDNPMKGIAESLGEIKYLGELQEQNRNLEHSNAKMSEELELYRSILPNLAASLSGGEH